MLQPHAAAFGSLIHLLLFFPFMTKLVAGYTPQARCTYLFMYVGVLWQYHQSVVAIKYNGFLLVACNDVPQKYRVTATKPRALVRQVSARTP